MRHLAEAGKTDPKQTQSNPISLPSNLDASTLVSPLTIKELKAMIRSHQILRMSFGTMVD